MFIPEKEAKNKYCPFLKNNGSTILCTMTKCMAWESEMFGEKVLSSGKCALIKKEKR